MATATSRPCPQPWRHWARPGERRSMTPTTSATWTPPTCSRKYRAASTNGCGSSRRICRPSDKAARQPYLRFFGFDLFHQVVMATQALACGPNFLFGAHRRVIAHRMDDEDYRITSRFALENPMLLGDAARLLKQVIIKANLRQAVRYSHPH